MSFRQTTVSGFPALALRSAELEVVVIPTIGMRLTNLRRLRGREWLWRNDQLPLALPRAGASYVETADSGGWDECFPTVGAIADSRRPAGRPAAARPWRAVERRVDQLRVYEHADGTTLVAGAHGTPRCPTSSIGRSRWIGRHRWCGFRYRLRHTGDAPFPWIWSAHPLLNVQPGTTLALPGVPQVKLDAVHGRSDLSRGDVVSWAGAIGRRGRRLHLSGGGRAGR